MNKEMRSSEEKVPSPSEADLDQKAEEIWEKSLAEFGEHGVESAIEMAVRDLQNEGSGEDQGPDSVAEHYPGYDLASYQNLAARLNIKLRTWLEEKKEKGEKAGG